MKTSQIVALWDYSCNIYQHKGVSKACLALQDEHGVDIPLLLFFCWSEQYFGVLPKSALESLAVLNDEWTQACIRPLRQVRKTMKQSQLMLEQPAWQQVRQELKALELEAEKQLLLQLEAYAYRVTDYKPLNAPVSGENIYQYWLGLSQDHSAQQHLSVLLDCVNKSR